MTRTALVRVQGLTSARLLNSKDAVPLRFHVLRGNHGVRADRSERADYGRDKTGRKHQFDLHSNLAHVHLRPAISQDQTLIQQPALAKRRVHAWWTAISRRDAR